MKVTFMSKGKLKASYLKIVSLWVCISIISTLAGCFGPSTPNTPVEINKNISLGNNLKTFSIKSDTLNATGVSVSGYIKYEDNGTVSYDYWNTPNKGSISINGEEINVSVGIYNGGSGSNIVNIKSSGGSIQPASNGCDSAGSRRTFYSDNLGYTTTAYAITSGNISYNISSATVSVTVTGLKSGPQSSLSVFSGNCSVSRLYTKKIVDASLTFNKSLPVCTIGSGITGFSCYPCQSNEITANNICQPCAEGKENFKNQCVDKCSESQVRDPINGSCKCADDKVDINGQCFPKCRADQIRNEDNSCGCTPENEEIDGQCIAKCFLGTVRNPETKQCEAIQCLEGYTLINGVCTYVPVPTPEPTIDITPEPSPTPCFGSECPTPEPSVPPCSGTDCPTPPPTSEPPSPPTPKPPKTPEPKPSKKPDKNSNNCKDEIQKNTTYLARMPESEFSIASLNFNTQAKKSDEEIPEIDCNDLLSLDELKRLNEYLLAYEDYSTSLKNGTQLSLNPIILGYLIQLARLTPAYYAALRASGTKISDATLIALRLRVAMQNLAAGTYGLSQFTYANRYGFASYRILKRLYKADVNAKITPSGLEVHHLIEKRFAPRLGVKANDMLSIVLTKQEHTNFTNLWKNAIPHGSNPRLFNTSTATHQQILDKAKEVYQNYPEILHALGL